MTSNPIEQWKQNPHLYPAPISEPRLREELLRNLIEFALREIGLDRSYAFNINGHSFEGFMPKAVLNKIGEFGAHVRTLRHLRAIVPEWKLMDKYGGEAAYVIGDTTTDYPRRHKLWDRSETLKILEASGWLRSDQTGTWQLKLGVKSLQELSTAKTLDVLRRDDNAVRVLLDLDDAKRHVLLPHLWQDYLRLSRADHMRVRLSRQLY